MIADLVEACHSDGGKWIYESRFTGLSKKNSPNLLLLVCMFTVQIDNQGGYTLRIAHRLRPPVQAGCCARLPPLVSSRAISLALLHDSTHCTR
jgi:hypothetical protein